jgi:hypothetical protein
MVETQPEVGTGQLEGKLSGAGWGLFIIWIGIAFLAGFQTWLTLIGIGIITLGMQLIRKASGLGTEGFWLVIGLLFLIGGIWDFSGTTLPLLPILLIVAGAGILVSIFSGRNA